MRTYHRSYYKIMQHLAWMMSTAHLPGKNYASRIRKG